MKTKVSRRKVGLLVAALLLALTPATALAWTGVSQGVLLEVLESPPAHAAPGGPTIPGAFPPGIGGRLAQATEAGTLVGSETLAFLTGDIEVHAQSRIPVDPATGGFGVGSVGTISGVFHVDNGGGVVTGKLEGTLDLTGAVCGRQPCPLAPTNGTWATLGKTKTSGLFSGVFFIPFQIPGLPGWFYLTPDPVTGLPFTQLLPSEFGKDGTPLVKLLVTLYQ